VAPKPDTDAYEHRVVTAVTGTFLPHRHPERAVAMAAYMRDQFPFLGIPTPERDSLSRSLIADLAPRNEAALARAARACWKLPEREFQYFGVNLVRRHLDLMTPKSVPAVVHMITTKSWWDTVDELAAHVVGPMVRRYPALGQTMNVWVGDDNIWLARTAILHQLRYKNATAPAVLFDHCLRRAHEKEFFLQKAIGWALREYSKTDPDAVRAFVAGHADELSALSRREALKWVSRG
jgi:3-methyladenine DNA glycosylase AlkD